LPEIDMPPLPLAHARRPALRRFLAAGVALSALAAMPARGQEAPAAPAAPPAAPGEVRVPPLTLLPPVNTTALRNPRRLFDTPATVDVIPGQELDRQMARNLEDVFRYTPGVTVNRQTSGTDPFGSLGGITVRGVGGNRVLTLVDGFRTIERITDQTRDVVDPWNLARVEVVRGPGSVLYGSDALGGVVNFITRNPSDFIRPGEVWGGEFSTSFGSVDSSLLSRITVAGRVDEFSAMFSYARRDASEPQLTRSRSPDGIWNCTRNLSAGATPCNRFDALDIASNAYFFRLVWDPLPNLRMRVTADVLDRTTDVDQRYDLGPATGGFTNLGWDRRQAVSRALFSYDVEWRPDYGWLDGVRFMVGYQPQEIERTGLRLRRQSNGQHLQIADSLVYSEDVLQGELQLNSSFELFGIRNVLTYGIAASTTATDYQRQDITTNLATGARTVVRGGGFNFANADTRRLDVFGQNEIALFDGRLTLIPGLRLSSTRISPRPDGDYRPVLGAEPKTLDETNLAFGVGAIFRLDDTWSLYANYGEGFKMPTAEQLFTSLPGTTFNLVPNPNLKPEQVRSVEGGVRIQRPDAYASLGAFYADYTDFIQSFVQIPGTIDITYQNLSEVRVWGIEFAGAWRFAPEWTVQAAASWQRGEQRATPNSPTRPFDGARPFNTTVGLTWDSRDLNTTVTFNGTYAAEVTRASSSQLYLPEAYTVFDLIASWRPLRNIEFNAGVFNIFNARYLPLPPGGTIYNRSEFTTNATKAVNPIELQVAPGINYRVGLRVTW
jgi:hemoglobin/transferrin/lactoferrin receptor protein